MEIKKLVKGFVWKSWIGIMVMFMMIVSILDIKVWEGKLSFLDMLAFSSCAAAILMVVIMCITLLIAEYLKIYSDGFFEHERNKMECVSKMLNEQSKFICEIHNQDK